MGEGTSPTGWVVWNEDADGTLIWAFRPDIFDGSTLSPACLPTITVKRRRVRGPRGRPAGPNEQTPWCAEFRLEPDVVVERTEQSDRSEAVRRATELAEAFSRGEINAGDAYDIPRNKYLTVLEEVLSDESSDFSTVRSNESR